MTNGFIRRPFYKGGPYWGLKARQFILADAKYFIINLWPYAKIDKWFYKKAILWKRSLLKAVHLVLGQCHNIKNVGLFFNKWGGIDFQSNILFWVLVQGQMLRLRSLSYTQLFSELQSTYYIPYTVYHICMMCQLTSNLLSKKIRTDLAFISKVLGFWSW